MVAVAKSVGIICALAAASAEARPFATIGVVSCEADNCLLVRGRRASPDAVVRINERPVAVSGGASWRVRLPVATARAWSAPFARTLRITVTDPVGLNERSEAVPLPVGVLGSKVELASLTVRAR